MHPMPQIDPRIGNARIGLFLTRGQIEHIGKMAVYAQMLTDNTNNTICYGSSEKSGVLGNPLTPDQKRSAIQGLWGPEAFDLVFLEDIGATDNLTDWADYVFRAVSDHGLAEPTDLYAGSLNDARWYEEHFASLKEAPAFRRGLFDVWENPKTGKRIHIMDRDANIRISSSDVRGMIERRDPAWRDHVPAKLWDFYERVYPGRLRAAIDLGDDPDHWPGLDHYPVGTRGVRATQRLSSVSGPADILILRADGKWRPHNVQEHSKSLGD